LNDKPGGKVKLHWPVVKIMPWPL